MIMGVNPATESSQIAKLLSTDDLSGALEALRMIAEFPEPGSETADSIAQSLFDIGFRLEGFERNQDAVAAYRRAVLYPVDDANITAGAWFRIAFLSDRTGNWLAASSGYRQALALAPAWAYMATLAQYHLAGLVAAEENYSEACALYQAVEDQPAHPDIHPAKVLLELGRCLLQSGERELARTKLEQLLANYRGIPATVEANGLLAEIHERSGENQAAVERYRHIAGSSLAEPLLKAAAAHRAAMLGRQRKAGTRG